MESIEDVLLNLIIKNQERAVVTSFSSYDKMFKKQLEKGENVINLHIKENCFAPGKYYADIGLSPYSGGLSFDVLLEYPIFEVKNNSLIHWLDRPFGNFLLNNVLWKG